MRLLALTLLLALVGCDRAQLDPVGAGLLVASPDLGIVQLDPDLTLRLTPPAFSGPLAVRVGGDVVAFDTAQGAYLLEVRLTRGLNRLPVEVIDDAGQVRQDTLYAVYLPLRPINQSGPGDATARADAASAPSLSAADRPLVTGGTGDDGQALSTASALRISGGQLAETTIPLQQGRTGHTATLVDGGTLLLGGTSTATASAAGDFVTQAEWLTPEGASQTVPVEGDVRRTRHTAQALTLRGVTYLYLYGGVIPSGAGLSLSGTVDIYKFETVGQEPRLTRLSPPGGSGGFTGLADHLQLATGATSATVLGLTQTDPISFAFDWSLPGTVSFPFSLRASLASGLAQPRTRAAAADLGGGLWLVSGGRDENGETLGSLEIHSAEADRSFVFPTSLRLQRPRYDHTATIFPGGRIVFGGGRTDGGSPLSSYESFQL